VRGVGRSVVVRCNEVRLRRCGGVLRIAFSCATRSDYGEIWMSCEWAELYKRGAVKKSPWS